MEQILMERRENEPLTQIFSMFPDIQKLKNAFMDKTVIWLAQ